MPHHTNHPEKKPPRYYVRRSLIEIKEQAARLIQTAERALEEIASVEKVRVFRWRCELCGNVRFFTKPQTVEACGECEKCKGKRWMPQGETKGEPLKD